MSDILISTTALLHHLISTPPPVVCHSFTHVQGQGLCHLGYTALLDCHKVAGSREGRTGVGSVWVSACSAMSVCVASLPCLAHNSEMVVFAAGDVLSQTLKALTFYRKESFSLEAWYQHPDKIPYTPPFIGKSGHF